MDLAPHDALSGGEEGATLILALVFMIIIALVLLAAVTFAGNGLLNTSNLLQQQSLEYRSNGAAEVAVQTVRYTDITVQGWQLLRRADRPPSRSGLPAPRTRRCT